LRTSQSAPFLRAEAVRIPRLSLSRPHSQFPIRLVKPNRAFKFAARIQNPNFTGPEACSGFGISDCLIFLREHRLNARSFKDFPAQRCGLISISVIARSQRSWVFAFCQKMGGNYSREFKKRGRLIIGTNNETLSVVPMRISNPDRSPFGIFGPTGISALTVPALFPVASTSAI
jgi:hypothetical protein